MADVDGDGRLSRDECKRALRVVLATAAATSSKADRKQQTFDWLDRIGALDVLAHAVDCLCEGDYDGNHGILRDLSAVQALAEGCGRRFAAVVSDAATQIASQKEAPFTPETIEDEKTRALFTSALAADRKASEAKEFAGAKLLYAPDGLPPWRWGISKKQFEAFVGDVRAAHAAGKIVNKNSADSSRYDYYPQSKFDDPQVCCPHCTSVIS